MGENLHEAGVDDEDDVVDGDGGLGDVGGEHHLAAAGGRRLKKGLLGPGGRPTQEGGGGSLRIPGSKPVGSVRLQSKRKQE